MHSYESKLYQVKELISFIYQIIHNAKYQSIGRTNIIHDCAEKNSPETNISIKLRPKLKVGRNCLLTGYIQLSIRCLYREKIFLLR